MKKSNPTLTKLKASILREKRRYLFALGLFLVGILLGSITSACADSSTTEEIKGYLKRFFSAYMIQGTAKSEAFRLSLMNHLQFALWLWISGWFLCLLPIGFFQTVLKGFRTGFTITYLIQCYHFKGILLSLIAILPQNLILLPAICFYLVYLLQFSSDRRHIRKGNVPAVVKKQIYGHHGIMTGIFLLLLLLCALIEGYIVPTLLQPLCGFFL